MRMTWRSDVGTIRAAGGRPTLRHSVGMERKKFQFSKDNPLYVNKPFIALEFDLFSNSE
jgi:hypothetical protein